MLRNSGVISQIRLAAANQRKSREVRLLRKREKIFQKPPKGPVNNRLIQELPEYNDRVSIVGHNRRSGRPKFYSPAKIEKLMENDDLRTREIETLFENEWRDKDPYNYPLFDVRKTPKMLREENYQEPEIIHYSQVLIQMNSFCFTTLHKFREIIISQLEKMDYDVLDIYPSPPDEYVINYKDDDPVKMEKYKRNIVVGNVNAQEIGPLTRQMADFTPEGVTLIIAAMENSDNLKFKDNEEVAYLKKLVRMMKETK